MKTWHRPHWHWRHPGIASEWSVTSAQIHPMFPTSCRLGSFPIWSICKYEYVYIHIHTHTHIHIYTYTYTYTYTYIYIIIYIYIHTYTHVQNVIHVHMNIHIYTCVFIIYILETSTHKKKLRSTHPLGRHRSSLPGDCTFSLVRRFPSWTPWWDGTGMLKYVLPLNLVIRWRIL